MGMVWWCGRVEKWVDLGLRDTCCCSGDNFYFTAVITLHKPPFVNLLGSTSIDGGVNCREMKRRERDSMSRIQMMSPTLPEPWGVLISSLRSMAPLNITFPILFYTYSNSPVQSLLRLFYKASLSGPSTNLITPHILLFLCHDVSFYVISLQHYYQIVIIYWFCKYSKTFIKTGTKDYLFQSSWTAVFYVPYLVISQSSQHKEAQHKYPLMFL